MTDQADIHDRELAREHLAALGILRLSRNAFYALAVLAVVLHLGCWFLARTAHPPPPSRSAAPWQDHTTSPGEAISRTARSTDGMDRWTGRMESALKAAGFIGRASALVIAGVYIIALLVSLSGRLGASSSLAKACVWSLAALALVTPWVAAGSNQPDSSNSAFYGADELMDSSVSIVRYVLCPLLVVVFLTLAQFEFRAAYRKISMLPSTRLPIHEV
ncbi:MAG: hypothetical protein ACE5EC_08550 [Phycisphaerae bacterium]